MSAGLGDAHTDQSMDESSSDLRKLSCLPRNGSKDPEESPVKTCSFTVEEAAFVSAVVNTGFISPTVSVLRTGRVFFGRTASVTWGRL